MTVTIQVGAAMVSSQEAELDIATGRRVVGARAQKFVRDGVECDMGSCEIASHASRSAARGGSSGAASLLLIRNAIELNLRI